MDNHSKEIRSLNMSHIRSTNSKPEELLRKFLFARGFRYRKNVKRLPGCPDIVLPKFKTIIFVNGCFWHMHTECGRFRWPATNPDYWKRKIEHNVQRDRIVHSQLKDLGWNVIVVWECELKKKYINETVNHICLEVLHNNTSR